MASAAVAASATEASANATDNVKAEGDGTPKRPRKTSLKPEWSQGEASERSKPKLRLRGVTGRSRSHNTHTRRTSIQGVLERQLTNTEASMVKMQKQRERDAATRVQRAWRERLVVYKLFGHELFVRDNDRLASYGKLHFPGESNTLLGPQRFLVCSNKTSARTLAGFLARGPWHLSRGPGCSSSSMAARRISSSSRLGLPGCLIRAWPAQRKTHGP